MSENVVSLFHSVLKYGIKIRGIHMNTKVMLINVEVVSTTYIQDFKNLHRRLANDQFKVVDDFYESSISAAYDQKEKTNYRYPRFDLFSDDHKALFDHVNTQIHPQNPILNSLVDLARQFGYKIAFIFDQPKKQGQHLAPALLEWVDDAAVFFGDQSFLGKPEPNLYVRAIKHFEANTNHALIIDSSRNGILAAHLANARSIYFDQGLGMSERIFKYSTYQINDLNEIEPILTAIENER
jgi:beta-phosphoglucomutase-like phosphatase (HAD superfamily)